MFTRLLLSTLAFLSIATSVHAQWDWLDNTVGGSFERVTDVAVDDTRSVVYSVGYLNGTPSFPEINGSSLGGAEDGFIIKHDTSGAVIWAFAIGGTSNDRINGITVDELTGSIYVTGFLEGTIATNTTSLAGVPGGAPGNVMGAVGSQDAFVASYNLFGQLMWYRIIGSDGIDRGMDIDVNGSAVFVTGFYTNNAILSSVSNVIPTNGSVNHFVKAINRFTGVTIWDATLGSSNDDINTTLLSGVIKRMGISADDNGVFVANYFRGTLFNIYDGSDSLAATVTDVITSNEDYVVSSFTNAGGHNWSVLYDNDGSLIRGIDVTNDCDGVYVSGSLHDNSTTPGGTVISTSHDDFILSKLNKNTGNEVWLKEFNSDYNHRDHFIGIDADGYGNLYAVGRLRGTSLSEGTNLNYTSGQDHGEIIIAHYHTDGAFQSFEVIPGTDAAWGMSIGTYKNEKYVVGGYYNGVISLGTITSSNGTENAFIASRILPLPVYYQSVSGDEHFCQSEPDPIASIYLPAGGTFTGPAQIVFLNTLTGEIDLSASVSGGPYTISYSGYPGLCNAVTAEFQIYIDPVEDAYFTYIDDHFCSNSSNILPTSIVTPGGAFIASVGLVLANASTGEIDAAASTIGGPYNLTYTTGGTYCPSSYSIQVYIDAAQDPAFGYSSANYCSGNGTILPSFINSGGGTFSAPAGITFSNIATGEIDLNASSVGGPYAIQYLVSNGVCSDSMTFSITIEQQEDAYFSYIASSFCNNEPNPIPISITTPGGTFSAAPGLVLANASTGEIDLSASMAGGPYFLVYTTGGVNCGDIYSVQIYIEDAPNPSFAYAQSAYCSGTITASPSFIASPGGTFTGPVEIVFSNVTTGEIDLTTSIAGGPYAIQYAVSSGACQDSMTFSLTINPTPIASFSFADDHFCVDELNPLPVSIATPGGSFSGPPELVINNVTGEIDLLASIAGGPYYVIYTTDSGAPCVVSDSFQVYIEDVPNAFFSYAQTGFCEGAGTIVPSTIMSLGGTFSGPSELVFQNEITGEVDVNASTVGGPYPVEYYVSNSYCAQSMISDLTILSQDELTTVGYSSGKYCVTDGNQLPEILGVSGGVFTGPTSIDIINSTSGEISPSTSAIGGPYFIEYVTPGVCPDSMVLSISVFDLTSAYAGEDQELYFSFKTTLEADFPVNGSGEWSSVSTALVSDVLDPISDVSELSLGNNTFTWTVSNEVCPATSEEVIIYVEDLFIPQSVTPNGDGKNDFFELRSIDDVTCSLQIFNRWGQVIYENSDYQNEWYGQNSNGKELKDDTYFYVIQIDDSISYNGYVVLKK